MSNEDDRDDATPTGPVQVYIFNQTYNLRSGSDEEYVRHVARLVDERMRQISSLAPTHDPVKVAVLAALHIADELEQVRESQPATEAAPPPEAADEAPEPAAGEVASLSWFESIFDPDSTGNRGGERLSDRVSERLQTRRQDRRRPITIEAGEDESPRAAPDRRAGTSPGDNRARD